MHQTRQQYENQTFMDQLRQQSFQPSLRLQVSSEPRSRRSHDQSHREFPHYWPADKVPYTGVTYCQCIQYVFAAMFFAVIIWIFVGLKNFGTENAQIKPRTSQSEKIQNKLVPQQKDLHKMITQNEYKAENSEVMSKEMFFNQEKNTVLNRVFNHESTQASSENQFKGDKKSTFELPKSDHLEV